MCEEVEGVTGALWIFINGLLDFFTHDVNTLHTLNVVHFWIFMNVFVRTFFTYGVNTLHTLLWITISCICIGVLLFYSQCNRFR